MPKTGSALLRWLAILGLALVLAVTGPLAALGWGLTAICLPVATWAKREIGKRLN